MIAPDLFKRAADSGVALYLNGETLKARGCRQAVEALSPELRIHKAEIVKFLVSARMTAANNPALAKPQPAELPDPDRWCWPHSSAMTGREIDTMAARTSQFNRRGLPTLEAELLADRLVVRDRDYDDRRLCLECTHLAGWTGAWRCTQWRRTGLGSPDVPADLAQLLQRCDGFTSENPKGNS